MLVFYSEFVYLFKKMLFIIHTSENSISEISCHSEIENNIGFKSFGGNRIKKKDTGGG